MIGREKPCRSVNPPWIATVMEAKDSLSTFAMIMRGLKQLFPPSVLIGIFGVFAIRRHTPLRK
jgi:hypothetical protein